jgi:hypothetical protein
MQLGDSTVSSCIIAIPTVSRHICLTVKSTFTPSWLITTTPSSGMGIVSVVFSPDMHIEATIFGGAGE